MEIVEPNVRVITETNPLKRIELCGRICYRSEDKIKEGSARKFVEARIKPDAGGNVHGSILEHARIKVAEARMTELLQKEGGLQNIPYGFEDRIRAYTVWTTDNKQATTHYTINVRDFLWLGGTLDEVESADNADDYITLIFSCDRGIWFEFNRHREDSKTNYVDDFNDNLENEFSFSQESTRYCNYQKRGLQFIAPRGYGWANRHLDKFQPIDAEKFEIWRTSCKQCEENYNKMIDLGCRPQEARDVLNTSLKTELAMTGTLDQWKRFMRLRTDKQAHPMCRYLMKMFTEDKNFPEELYEFKNYF